MANKTDTSFMGRANPWLLGFILVGGAIAWLVDFLVASLAAEWGCLSGLYQWRMAGVSSIAWIVLASSLIAIGVAGLAMWCAIRLQPSHDEDDVAAGETGRETTEFLARVGLLVNPVFMLIIVVQTIPVFFFLVDC